MISRSFGGLFFILLDIVMRSRQLLNSADLCMFFVRFDSFRFDAWFRDIIIS